MPYTAVWWIIPALPNHLSRHTDMLWVQDVLHTGNG